MSGWDSDYRYEPAPLYEEVLRCGLPMEEAGNRIIMPLSSLHLIDALPLRFPLFFKLQGFSSHKLSYCGVLDFTAEEGFVHLPCWLMRHLALDVGDQVVLRDASLSAGFYMKLRPHEAAFVELSDPRAVLEQALRGYVCLSRGDTFLVRYNGRDYYLDVLEVSPGGEAVSLIDTDCSLDFAPPLDHVEPPRGERAGCMERLKEVKEGKEELRPSAAAEEAKEDGGKEEFKAFTGEGRVLGGRFLGRAVASSGRAVVAGASYKSALVEGSKKMEKDDGGKDEGNVAEIKAGGGRGGRVIGGGTSSEEAKKDDGKDEVKEFKAFSGRGRVLGGTSVDAAVESGGWSVPATRVLARAAAVEEKKGKKDEAKEEFKAFTGKGRVLGGPLLFN